MSNVQELMQAMPIFSGDVRVKSQGSPLSSFVYLHKEGEIFFNPEYQREYVWTEKEQQQLLHSIFNGLPFLEVSVVYNHKGPKSEFCEVVDARQRLTTIFKFIDGEIGFILPSGQKVFYSDLSKMQRSTILSSKVTELELSSWDESKPVTLKQKIEYFYAVNFYGMPQSEEHKKKIEDMLISDLPE